ncbi:uncharacterized protein B0H18DRAFT_1013167 [Fomitopsis serialis]|uniref:uncharacterized protein n=1 Tax=Fomitopsis serialis TaxID=139415 RepID=UPI0020089716|nr:uncharacterized protein B0H18DRAFT_1013167 [Neoantrodia serialis]KAH9924046.1 hypothetical protein B0H18DRAFT_1013167 [Neoantrodia serialis]
MYNGRCTDASNGNIPLDRGERCLRCPYVSTTDVHTLTRPIDTPGPLRLSSLSNRKRVPREAQTLHKAFTPGQGTAP